MTTVSEAVSGIQFLVSTLENDATLRSLCPGSVHRGMAPSGTVYPLAIVAFMSGIDVLTANAYRLMVNALYQVKASGPVLAMQSVVNLASRIDALLARTSGSTTGGYILSCYRESSLQIDEVITDVEYTSIGGMYRLIIQQMPF